MDAGSRISRLRATATRFTSSPYHRRVSTRIAAGQRPVWTPDGKELFFDRDGVLNVVSIATSPRLTIGTPVRLPITNFIQGFGRRTYDLTPDGRYFLMLSR